VVSKSQPVAGQFERGRALERDEGASDEVSACWNGPARWSDMATTRPGVFRVRSSTEVVHLQMGPQMPHPELAGLYRKFARSERRQSSAVVRPENAPAARAVALPQRANR
jgi:hypothetical protein